MAVTCCTHACRQGRDCPLRNEPAAERDEPVTTPEECEGWARALAYVLGLIFSLCVWMAVICAVSSCTY